MQEQVNYLITQQQNQHEQFSCAASLSGSFNPFNKEKKQDDHGPQLCADSNAEQSKPPAKSNATQSKLPAKSQSKSKISKDKEKTSPKPRRSKTGDEDEEKTKVDYYKTFPERKHGEPALVPMQDSKTVMLSAIQMPSFSALQVVFVYLISHQVKII